MTAWIRSRLFLQIQILMGLIVAFCLAIVVVSWSNETTEKALEKKSRSP